MYKSFHKATGCAGVCLSAVLLFQPQASPCMKMFVRFFCSLKRWMPFIFLGMKLRQCGLQRLPSSLHNHKPQSIWPSTVSLSPWSAWKCWWGKIVKRLLSYQIEFRQQATDLASRGPPWRRRFLQQRRSMCLSLLIPLWAKEIKFNSRLFQQTILAGKHCGVFLQTEVFFSCNWKLNCSNHAEIILITIKQ